MSVPSVIKGQYLNILLGNGASPEVFAIICGITTRSFTDQVNTGDVYIRDCAAPENIPVRKVNVTGQAWELSGSGYLNRAQQANLYAALGVTKNWRFDQAQPTGDTVYGGHWDGPAVLESIKLGATDGDLVAIDLTIKSDGVWSFTVV